MKPLLEISCINMFTRGITNIIKSGNENRLHHVGNTDKYTYDKSGNALDRYNITGTTNIECTSILT